MENQLKVITFLQNESYTKTPSRGRNHYESDTATALVNFVNENRITKEQIVSINQAGPSFTLFYYE